MKAVFRINYSANSGFFGIFIKAGNTKARGKGAAAFPSCGSKKNGVTFSPEAPTKTGVKK